MSRYRWILVDLDGTLLDFHRAESGALRQTADEFEISLSKEAVASYAAINAALWKDFEQGTITALGIRNVRFARWLDALGIEREATALSKRFLQLLVEHSTFLEGAEDLLNSLRESVHMALITNGFADVQRGRVSRFALDRWFDPILISEELGLSKPNPGIFEVALQRMGNPAKQDVLILGDSLSSDIRGGAEFGIDTCWFNPEQSANNSDVVPTYEIRRLCEVSSIIETGAHEHA